MRRGALWLIMENLCVNGIGVLFGVAWCIIIAADFVVSLSLILCVRGYFKGSRRDTSGESRVVAETI